MTTAQLSWRITLTFRMASWSLRWIRSLDRLCRTPSRSQILSRNRSPSPSLMMTAQQINSTMKPSCMVILVSHQSTTHQAVAQAALSAISLGLLATQTVGIQLRRPAVVCRIRCPQVPTSMAKRPLTRKLAFVLRAASNAVGAGPRMIP